MFGNLTERFSTILRNLSGQGRLTDDNIQETLRQVRTALFEADVAFPVVNSFIDNIQKKAIGQDILKGLAPGQALIKIVHDELVSLMGEACDSLNLATSPPAVIMMVGLQGSGKTTSTAKLAWRLKEREKKSVLVVSVDVSRPAAIKQLEVLAKSIPVEFYPSHSTEQPVDIAKAAIQFAKQHLIDVVLIDTAGRLHIDADMMSNMQELHAETQPIETLFVVDSTTGQDAATVATAFNEAIPLTGIILTKADGDARGGAALSIRAITQKPIKFIGMGEKIEALEPFYPDRIASRILGMGDVLSLVEEVGRKIDHEKAEKFAQKLKKGKTFDLEDFRAQIQQVGQMGGMGNLLDKLPGTHSLPAALKDQIVNGKALAQTEAIINSMTPKERRFPDIIRSSRKRRIAAGSGTQVQDINRLLKQFLQMQKMMKQLQSGKLWKMMQNMKGMSPFG